MSLTFTPLHPIFAAECSGLDIGEPVSRENAAAIEDAMDRYAVLVFRRGTPLTTVALATKLKDWQLKNDAVALVIGGPDGLEPAFRQAAHERIRLSDLTLPHAMVRVLLAEQLYRAWSINAGHPYHRE